MNSRIARKILRRCWLGSGPETYSRPQVYRALRVYRRWEGRKLGPACGHCPIPTDNEGTRCANARICGIGCTADVLRMDLELRRHPWGDWKCLIQRAKGAR